ncbi:MAG: hypothetical protein JXA04_00205 [Gammaproteobacteria bacterium]|nr:hypothetical protein [Gammaproteobacteria bacterium]
MRYLATLLIFACMTVAAAPNAGEYIDVSGVRVYQDHEKVWLWYIDPAEPKLDLSDGPGYALDLFRYLGRSGTGDKDQYWTRGILSLKFERSRPETQLQEIKNQLQKKTGGRLSIKSLPVFNSEIQVNFADTDSNWQQTGRWQGGVLQLVLDATQSQLLWEAESSLLSLSVTESSNAQRIQKNEWVPAMITSSWTVDVPMSQKHLSAYRKNDLTAQLGMAYNAINVFCFDFLEQTTVDLYAKEVEIGFQSGDRPLLERARFDANSDYKQHIRFPLAKTQDEPLRYRVIETFNDGRRLTGPWQRKDDEYMLDITSYRILTEDNAAGIATEASEPSDDE